MVSFVYSGKAQQQHCQRKVKQLVEDSLVGTCHRTYARAEFRAWQHRVKCTFISVFRMVTSSTKISGQNAPASSNHQTSGMHSNGRFWATSDSSTSSNQNITTNILYEITHLSPSPPPHTHTKRPSLSGFPHKLKHSSWAKDWKIPHKPYKINNGTCSLTTRDTSYNWMWQITIRLPPKFAFVVFCPNK